MINRKSPSLLTTCVLFITILFFNGCSGSGKKPSEKPSSVGLIQEDLENKKISYDDAILYQTYAIFKSPSLPNKYKSDALTRHGTTLMKEIRRNWDKLDPKTQNKLKPFFINPLKKDSFLFQASKPKESTNWIIPQAFANTPGLPDFTSLNSHHAANGKVTIWYKNNEQQQAQWLIEAFDSHNIYQRETGLMNRHPRSDLGNVGPDGRLDIILADISDMGLCVPGNEAGTKTSAHIFVNKNMTREQVQNSVAHELFHAIQYNIDVEEADWWQDMTATWIEDYIYKSYDIEHGYLKYYFKNYQMRHTLAFQNDKFEYGAYVWPLYLSQKHGAGIIKTIWDKCETMAALTALVQAVPGGMEKAFKEFGLWVYNIEPERKFRDIGGGFLPIKPSIKKQRISVGGVIAPLVDLPYLSLTMEKLYLTAQDKTSIRSIDFDLSDFHNENPKVALWAVIKIVDKDEVVEDWSNVNIRNYCFDLPEEDLENIVFIFVNASPTVPYEAANLIDYTAKEHGCEAKLDLTWSIVAGGKGDWQHIYENSGGLKASMSADIRTTESGELSVSFIEKIVNPSDPDSGKQLVPYGVFSARMHNKSSGHMAPTQSFVMAGSSTFSGAGSDSWNGNKRSQTSSSLLSLQIEMPEPENTDQLSADELAQIPQAMQQQLAQMQAMVGQLENTFNSLPGMPRKLAPNERRYKIFVSFGQLPAHFSSTLGDNEQTTFSPQKINLQEIFNVDQTTIPINKTFTTNIGTSKITGTLRIKKQE